jgi:hypothetical protein
MKDVLVLRLTNTKFHELHESEPTLWVASDFFGHLGVYVVPKENVILNEPLKLIMARDYKWVTEKERKGGFVRLGHKPGHTIKLEVAQ